LSRELRFGVIGLGYWGPRIVRNLALDPRITLACVADLHQERCEAIARQYPYASATTDAEELLDDPHLDAIVIATPASTHFELAMAAIDRGKHVLVTKPLADSVAKAEKLVAAAGSAGVVLLVDHTFAYTGAVEKMRELVHQRFLGDIYYFDSVRVNLGLFQQDVNVIWDLAAHDFSILDQVLPEKPNAVQVVAVQRASRTFEDIAYVTVFYPSGMLAHVHVSWLSPVKIRSTLVGGSERMLLWDDLAPDEKLKIYDHGVSLSEGDVEGVYQMLVDYRIGDIWIPHIDRGEALTKEVAHFVDCIDGNAEPRTGGESGLRVVQLLMASSLSVEREGERVALT